MTKEEKEKIAAELKRLVEEQEAGIDTEPPLQLVIPEIKEEPAVEVEPEQEEPDTGVEPEQEEPDTGVEPEQEKPETAGLPFFEKPVLLEKAIEYYPEFRDYCRNDLYKKIREKLSSERIRKNISQKKTKEISHSVRNEAHYPVVEETEKNASMIPVAVCVAILALSCVLRFTFTGGIGMSSDAYVASTSKDAAIYVIGRTEDDQKDSAEKRTEDSVLEIKRLVRGTPVNRLRDSREVDGVKYVRVEEEPAFSDAKLPGTGDSVGREYMRADDLADSLDDIVRETEVYVRTPATIYAEAEGPKIASFAPKSSCLKVTGFDRVNKDGSIHKYKVEYDAGGDKTAEGYIYGKYLVDTQEKADAVYNENGIHDKAKKDKYSFNLYGGKAANLDYYPYEKPEIEGNKFCEYARTMYINGVAAVNPKKYTKIIEETDCNAVVIDIKDGYLAYESEVAKEVSPASYKTAYSSVEEFRKGVDAYRETGAYLIGRIVVFNDSLYAKDHPKDCIKYHGSAYWPSAYSRNVWEYNVRLAQEAVREFGFNEIQFDYVRFPESSYEMSKSGKANWRNKYNEEKGQAVQNFCFYAADQIHEAGAYFSIDVFGESAYGYMTAYGQYWMGLSNIVDAISAMPYTDHTGGEGAWNHAYDTVYKWAKRAKKQQKKLKDPAAARTWITGYDTPYWNPTVDYGPTRLKQQVRALKDAGLDGGFIPWNASSSLAKYRQYKKVWNE